MFYANQQDDALRFGDVLEGFPLAACNIEKPAHTHKYQIEIRQPRYCVILSPCCSIGKKIISLAPLIKIRPSFLKNPYFRDDLTNINRRMHPMQAFPPGAWEKLSADERQRRLGEGLTYAFVDVFVYGEHDLLPRYTLDLKDEPNLKTRYHMLDFRQLTLVNCSSINSPKESPLSAKVLQLDISSREELRQKLSTYFSRVPKEDAAMMP